LPSSSFHRNALPNFEASPPDQAAMFWMAVSASNLVSLGARGNLVQDLELTAKVAEVTPAVDHVRRVACRIARKPKVLAAHLERIGQRPHLALRTLV
jgi:hypothetical protein